jgi:hypothetical protein
LPLCFQASFARAAELEGGKMRQNPWDLKKMWMFHCFFDEKNRPNGYLTISHGHFRIEAWTMVISWGRITVQLRGESYGIQCSIDCEQKNCGYVTHLWQLHPPSGFV